MMCRCCSGCCFSCSICCAKCGGKSNVIDLSNGSTPQSNGDSNAMTKPLNLVKIGNSTFGNFDYHIQTEEKDLQFMNIGDEYSNVPNKRACTFISGKVCLLGNQGRRKV